jgi:pimeloyl-ACP methyl ester carboxylesterase
MTLPSTLPVPQTWTWQQWSICYEKVGDQGPAVIFIHGFGASWGHWRKNLPELGKDCRCYALDLIGFGDSDKPSPGEEITYTFPTWAKQVADFCQSVIGEPVFLVGNSIGCIVALQMAVDYPELVKGVALLNCSLRLLHERKQANLPFYKRYGASIVQQLLAFKPISNFFFAQLATPRTVRNILLQAYCRAEAVTDELVAMLLKPAADPGAVDVFVAFTSYSQGPLPEDLLPQVNCPILILWGDADPWEPIALGEKLAEYPRVEKFIPLPNIGHCPQDEAPEIVNPLLKEWLDAKTAP